MLLRIGAGALGDLRGELAGRGEHQHADALGDRMDARVGEPVERRQHERRGLAGAGLGDAEQVAAGQDGRDGLRLDRRRHGVIFRRERVEEGLREPEVGKFGQEMNPICKANGRA